MDGAFEVTGACTAQPAFVQQIDAQLAVLRVGVVDPLLQRAQRDER